MEHREKEREAAWADFLANHQHLTSRGDIHNHGFDAGYQAGSEGRWVAVSDPSKDGEYLVTLTGGAIRNALWADGEWSDPDFGVDYATNSEAEVLAWAELPQPYTPADQEEENADL